MEDERDQEVDLAVGLVERPALAQQPVEQRRGAAAGRGHVDMRIGAVADHCAGVRDHRRGHVGVVVEARYDRHPVADQGADAAQQFALAIVVMLGHHRAVQVEIDAVDFSLRRRAPARSSSIAPAHVLIGVALDIGGGRRRAPAQRHDLVTERLQPFDRTGDRDVVAA